MIAEIGSDGSGDSSAMESSTTSSLTGSRVTSPSTTDTNDSSSGSESTLSADAAEAMLDAALSNAALLGQLGSSVEWLRSQSRRPRSQPATLLESVSTLVADAMSILGRYSFVAPWVSRQPECL